MPVVPMTRDLPPTLGEGPSETNLLMALAEMHRQGRVSRPSEDRTPSPKPRKSKTAEGPF